jgi:hypothetical protein
LNSLSVEAGLTNVHRIPVVVARCCAKSRQLLMNLRQSRILKLLRQGGLPAVLKLSLSDPRAIELAGLSGADAIWLCMEHVPNDWISLENHRCCL